MNLYSEQFLEKHDFGLCKKPSKILIIASTGRSGSHMLGHALYQTKRFGFPLEYANSSNLIEWRRRLGLLNIKEIIAELQRKRTSDNGVFGIKIHYSQICQFGGFDQLVEMFPNAYYILLSRKDILAQAVSLSIAKQTGVWISGQQPVNDNPVYSFTEIDENLRSIILDNSSWRYSLAASGANYIEMTFEDIRSNMKKALINIAGFIGINIDDIDIPTQQMTSKQGNQQNEDWKKRFIYDFNKCTEL